MGIKIKSTIKKVTSVPTNRKELESMPVGSKLTDIYGKGYEKVDEGKWKTTAGNGSEMFENNNSMFNRGLEKYTASQNGQESSSSSEEYSGETLKGVGKAVYADKKENSPRIWEKLFLTKKLRK
ncbi:hypothetical protein FACS18949_14400 [Clostridia bacterium]|nr:hypothetical protein FACS18949_14400 [Clostridia bacterium]